MTDKTVTLSDQEWQQLVGILAQATGYVTLNKLVGQLQAQDAPVPAPALKPGDGLDPDPPAELIRRVPRA